MVVKKEQFMKLSARNQIKGTVVSVEDGAVNGIVTLDIGGGNRIVSSITMESIKNLGLKPGAEAYAVIKASSVMMAVK
jgi:molybdopterin-binding protein